MKNLVLIVWFLAGFVWGVVCCSLAKADDYHIIDLHEMMVDYKNFNMLNSNGHEYMTYPDPPKESLNLNLKLDVFRYFYIDPTVESWTTDSQYRAIGLEVRAGMRVNEYLELGIYHHSQHQLDRTQQLEMSHFPESDSFELRLYLFKSKTSRESLF